MKTLKSDSPYSKMYLIPPHMYETLLSCLDEKEKRLAENLNIEKEEEKPAERQIEMLTEQELNPIEPLVTEEIIQPPPGERENIEEGLLGEQEEIPEESEENLTTAQLRKKNRLIKEREIKGALEFKKAALICNICLKQFKNNWSLNRHYTSVHKNIIEKEGGLMSEQNIPTMLNIQQRQPAIVQSLPEEDIPMRQACKTSADTTKRVIPELIFRPPKSGKIIIPEMKKRMQLRGPSFKTKPKIIVPQIMKKAEEGEVRFKDWSKKPGSRTGSEANLSMKPTKWYKPSEDPEYDPNYEKWLL